MEYPVRLSQSHRVFFLNARRWPGQVKIPLNCLAKQANVENVV